MTEGTVDGYVIMECERIMNDPNEPAARRRLARQWFARLTHEGERSALPIVSEGNGKSHKGSDFAQYAQNAQYEGWNRAGA